MFLSAETRTILEIAYTHLGDRAYTHLGADRAYTHLGAERAYTHLGAERAYTHLGDRASVTLSLRTTKKSVHEEPG